MACTHKHIIVIRTEPFCGPVCTDENRAAHGDVTYTVECAVCGAQRRENHNQLHAELGGWGPTRAAREEHIRQLQRALPPLPPVVTLTRGDGETATFIPSDDGYLVIRSSAGVSQREQDGLGVYYPHLDALVARRIAVLELELAQAAA